MTSRATESGLTVLWKSILAVLIALGVMFFLGATAWSAERYPGLQTRSSYSDAEMASVETGDETQVRDIRNQETTQLRIALGRRLPANRRADLYLRLAEIYLEMYHTEFLIEGRVHEKRLSKGIPDKLMDRGRSKPILALGIKACNDILRLRIPFEKMDRVYYFLGFYHLEQGGAADRKAALRYFEQLTSKYPASPFVVEAYREMGEAAFDDGNFRRAQALFEKALRAKNLGETLPRVLHKLSWAYYRTKQFDRAVSTMKDAIAKTGENNEKFLSLREEALRDMAVFMTEIGKVEEAIAYFADVSSDKDYYPRMLERLGKQYERNVEPQKAVQVYESLLKTGSNAEAAFRVRVKLFDLELRRGRFKEALARIQGVKVPDGGESDTMTAAQNLRAMVRRTATEQHENYRKNNARGALETADLYYSAYLNQFVSNSDSRNEKPEIEMYLADVKRELGKSKEASDLYRRVVDSKDKRYAKEAAALWTASLADAIRKAGAGTGGKSEEPSVLEKEFVDAADDLQDSLGDTIEGREAALRAAQVLGGYKKTQKDAIKRSEKIIKRSAKSPQALTAARLLVQLYADLGDLDDLGEAIKDLRDNKDLIAADESVGQGKLKALLAEQDQKQKVGAIATFEKDKDYISAAKGYEQFAAEATTRELIEKAYGNSAGSYAKALDFGSAERVTLTWIKRYPDSKVAVEALRTGATAALIQGRFEVSASLFDSLGRMANDMAALETAARLYDGVGQPAQAREAWQAQLRSPASRISSTNAAFINELALAKSYDGDQLDSDAAKHYKSCAGGPPAFAAECGARLADLYRRGQDVAGARATYRRVSELKKNPSPFIGYARYRLAEMLEVEARLEPMTLPEAQLKKALNQRLEYLEKLSQAYNSAVESGGPWGIAALDRLALWVFNLAEDIDRIPAAAGADAKVAAQFRKNLLSVSDPLRKKAIQTWNDAYRKSQSQEILSPALPGIVDHLAEAAPAHYIRAQGSRGRFRLSGIPADGGSEGRSGALERTRERLLKNAQDSMAWVDYGNLIWGDGKAGLARIAYERALSLNPKSATALNNRAVVTLSGGAEEDWFRAAEANELFKDALRGDDFFLAAKMNLAILYNYYRIFARAKPLWTQVLSKAQAPEAHEGLAIALQGSGDLKGAEASFAAAGGGNRFVAAFHEAARAAVSKEGASRCLAKVAEVDESAIGGFEKQAVENLRKACTTWVK